MTAVICFNTFKESRVIRPFTLIESSPEESKPEMPWYSVVRHNIEARFGDKLPNHFKRAMLKPQSQPYRFGDPHAVTYRTKQNNFNKPFPVPCEVTAKSCTKFKGRLQLGSMCLQGIDEPFPWSDSKNQVSLRFLKSLPKGTKLDIMTRSDLIAREDYISELLGLDVTVHILIPTFISDAELRQLEPGSPSIKRRLAAVEKLKQLGIKVFAKYHTIAIERTQAK